MIPFFILAGLIAGVAVVAITFWDQIKKFLQQAYDKVKKIVNATVIGVATFLQTNNWREGIKAAYKFYSKNAQGQWQETTTTAIIEPNEVPEHIRRKLEKSEQPIDVSEELELELK